MFKLFTKITAAVLACSLFYGLYQSRIATPEEPDVQAAFLPISATDGKKSLLSPGYVPPDTLKKLLPEDAQNILVLYTEEDPELYVSVLLLSIAPSRDSVQCIRIPGNLYLPYAESICNTMDEKNLFSQEGIFMLREAGRIGTLLKYRSDFFEDSDIAFTADVLTQLIGIPIHDFAAFGDETLCSLIDTVGGVTVTVPSEIRAGDGSLLFREGRQKLNGARAVLYAHTARDATDFFLPAEFFTQLGDTSSLARLPQLIRIATHEVRHSFSVSEISGLYRFVRKLHAGQVNVQSLTLSGTEADPLHDGCRYLVYR